MAGPSRRPKCPPRPEAKIRSEGVNDVWCLDLVFDVTSSGTTIKFLTIIDEGSHYCIDPVHPASFETPDSEWNRGFLLGTSRLR